MPAASNVKVLTSASVPSAGTSLPLNKKLTPAALPTLTTISRLARTEVCAGAMSVSSAGVWPSAEIETHEFSEARMISVMGVAGFAAALAFAGKVRTMTSFSSTGFVVVSVCGLAGFVVVVAVGIGEFGVAARGEVPGLGVVVEADVWLAVANTGADAGADGCVTCAVLAAAVRVLREWRVQRNAPRATTSNAAAMISHGIPPSRLSANARFGGRTFSARGSCRSGSSSSGVGAGD